MKSYWCVLIGASLLWTGCSKKDASDSDEAKTATPVQVASAKQEPIHRYISAEGILYPLKQASIVPKISAPVARFLVQRGDHVHAGQLVAVLEHQDLSAAAQESRELYLQADATYINTSKATMPEDATKAQADVQSTKEALDAAQRLYDNRKALLKEGALAQKLVDDAQVALVQAKAQYDTAQQHLNSLQSVGRTEQLRAARSQAAAAKAHYASSEAQVNYADVRSPISGVVSDRPLNIGEMASSGSALLTVVDLSKVVARASIPVSEASFIKVGAPATLTGPAGDLDGKVTVVSPAVDPNTTTIQVWVQAVNTKELFKPGATVQLSMDAGTVPNAVVVPKAALLSSEEGGERVMIAGKDGLAHEQDVKVGIRSNDVVQILDGVKPGDQVITEGALGLDDKAKIQIGAPASDKKDE